MADHTLVRSRTGNRESAQGLAISRYRKELHLRILLVLFTLSGILGCERGVRPDEKTAAVYLAAVEDLSRALAPEVFCVSPHPWYDEATRLPKRARETLEEAGFEFVDVREPHTIDVRILTLSPIREDSLGIRVTADLSGFYISGSGVCGWADAWDYILLCEGRSCGVKERIQSTHSDWSCDKTSPRARAMLAGEGVRCPSVVGPNRQ